MNFTVTNIIPELRARKKITQDSLAGAVGVTRQTIISIEKGVYTPSLSLTFAISQYFELPIESIFFTSS